METCTQLQQLLNTILNVLVIPLLPIVTAFLIALIKRKTAELESNIHQAEISKYLNMAENAVITAVTAVNQVYVDTLKKKNGSLTADEQKAAFEMSREKVLKILGDSAVNALQSIYQDFNIWLESRIEYQVNRAKTVVQPQSGAEHHESHS